jgi:CRISPR-associated protein Cas1
MERVLVLHGYGIRLSLKRSHLVVEDGLAEKRRVRRLSRIDRDVKRIAIIGHAGTISLDAIRWLHDVKIPLIHLDTDGRVLALVTPDSPDHPTLRRAQARAVDTEVGREIMRELLRQKLNGQERVLRSFTAGQLAIPQMELRRRELAKATDYVSLRSAESQAAAAYWNAWGRVAVEFRQCDRDRVPEHWLRFGQRVSALSGSPRLAINPANAMLNYLYAILEAEARLALLAVGCDPGVGIQHADERSRDSMACDVMEAVRPAVDMWLLEYLEQRTLRQRDFLELRNGQCRLMPDLAKELAQSASLWAEKLGPVVEGMAQQLYAAAIAPEQPKRWAQRKPERHNLPPQMPTPLTEQRRSRGRPRASFAVSGVPNPRGDTHGATTITTPPT